MTQIAMLLTRLAAASALLLISLSLAKAAEDNRELVKLPPMMQEHMLANMRDHLVALNEIFAALAVGDTDQATQVAEARLGMSSMELHGAAHLGRYMPKEMGMIGTQLHRSASRFVIAAQDAELNPSKDAQREVYKALEEITANCNACHQGYRLR